MRVFVFVCEREKVCTNVCERERERMCVQMCVRERENVCTNVCVCLLVYGMMTLKSGMRKMSLND